MYHTHPHLCIANPACSHDIWQIISRVHDATRNISNLNVTLKCHIHMSSSPRYPFQPLHSSPLNDSSPSFARRRLQFKSQISHGSTLQSPLTSRRTRSTPSNGTSTSHILSRQDSQHHFPHPEDPQKQFLRERMRARCFERVQKARARAVKQRRYTGYSDRSSDGFDMDEDEEEADEEKDDDIMSEEVLVLFLFPILYDSLLVLPLSFSFGWWIKWIGKLNMDIDFRMLKK